MIRVILDRNIIVSALLQTLGPPALAVESNKAGIMTVTFPDDLLASAKLTEAELIRELALTLFQRERLTLAQALAIKLLEESGE